MAQGRRQSRAGRSNDLATKAAEKASEQAAGWTTLVTGIAITAFLWWRNRQYMDFSEYQLLNTAFILFVPLLIVMLVLRREPTDFGMTVGESGKGNLFSLGMFLLFVPVILFFAPKPDAQNYYLNWLSGSRAVIGAFGYGPHGSGVIDWSRLAYHELAMAFYMFGWEWHFRGFLLFGLKRLVPIWAAVLIQAVLFTLLHYGKPWSEVASSFPGAIIMAVLALRSKSFLPCFTLHFLVSAGFDAAVLFYHFKG